jgi:predicted enzyme related to lactoylglutathione lyase
MPNPVAHFEIVGGDGKKIQAFYRDVFGWNVDANNEWNYGMTTPEDTGIGGGIAATMDVPRVTIYVQVPDPQAFLDKAESLGGKTLMPVTEIPGAATIAMFSDPQGNVLGLLKEQ